MKNVSKAIAIIVAAMWLGGCFYSTSYDNEGGARVKVFQVEPIQRNGEKDG